ncbi:vacuolar protein sorting-associated protein 13B-like [Sipha flava]|uniref:Vacuolar protein sorting-associated protein 13B-like n=1 Tax=Sipha flava TaxID=143950 RepID=A0A8B8G6S9_9HEMI|nr:vacuolar protein sorting-associated protein 13B-like [Sipha flava]
MFRIESYITSIILSYVEKYVKNLRRQDAQVSLWDGEGLFQNLELDLDVLEKELNLPFIVLSGHINQLLIRVPWTKLGSEAVKITIDTIECVLKLKTPQQKNTKKNDKSYRASTDYDELPPPSYVQSLINKIIGNLSVTCNNVILKYIEDDIVLSMNIKSITLDSCNENWIADIIELTPSQLVLRKIINLSDVTICLDRRNASGCIETYLEPLLYKCSLSIRLCRMFRSPHSARPFTTQMDLFCSKIAFILTEPQLPMFLRLLTMILELNAADAPETNTCLDDESYNRSPSSCSSISETNIAHNDSWVDWMWSWVPNVNLSSEVNELPFSSEAAVSGHSLNTGIYIDTLLFIFKIKSTKKLNDYRPLLQITLRSSLLEMVSHPLDWINVQFGISKASIEPLGDCTCGAQDCYTNTYFSSGVLQDSYLLKSLFRENININAFNDNIFSFDHHLNQFSETILLEKTSAFAVDYLFTQISNINQHNCDENPENYSTSEEKCLLRFVAGPSVLNVSSGLIHRVEFIYKLILGHDLFLFTTLPQSSRLDIDEKLNTLNNPNIQIMVYQFTIFNPTVKIYPACHVPIPSSQRHKKNQKSCLKQFDPVFKNPPIAIFELKVLDGRIVKPKKKMKWSSIPQNITEEIKSLMKIKTIFRMKDFVIKITFSSFTHKLIKINNIGFTSTVDCITNFNSDCLLDIDIISFTTSKENYLLIYYIINSIIMSNHRRLLHVNHYIFKSSLLNDAPGSIVLKFNLEGAKIYYKLENQISCIKTILNNISAKMVLYNSLSNKQSAILVSTPEFIKNAMPFLHVILQLTDKIDSNDMPLIYLKVGKLDMNFDPMLFDWLIYIPEMYNQKEIKKKNSTSDLAFFSAPSRKISETSISSDKKKKPKPSIQSSISENISFHSANYMHLKIESKEMKILHLFNKWKSSMVFVDTSKFALYFPSKSLSMLEKSPSCKDFNLKKLIEMSTNNGNGLLVFRISKISLNCILPKNQIEPYLNTTPVRFPNTLWSPGNVYFPWQLNFLKLECYTIHSSYDITYQRTYTHKIQLLYPFSAQCTLAITTQYHDNSIESLKSLAACIHCDSDPVSICISEQQVRLVADLLKKQIEVYKVIFSNIEYGTFFNRSVAHEMSSIPEDEIVESKIQAFDIKKTKENIKLSGWFQWTLARFSLIIKNNPEHSSTENVKLVLDLEDVISSLDFGVSYHKLKLKISSASIQHFVKNIKEEQWKHGPYLGLILKGYDPLNNSEKSKTDGFINFTLTRAFKSSFQGPKLNKDNTSLYMVSDEMLKLNQQLMDDYIMEIVIKVQPIDIVISPLNLHTFLTIIDPLLEIFINSEYILNPSSNSHDMLESTKGLFGSTLPLFYLDIALLRIFIPISVLDYKIENHDTVIIQVNSVKINQNPENPIARTPLRKDLYAEAEKRGLLTIPGSIVEDRQYQIIINGFSIKTGFWIDFKQVLKFYQASLTLDTDHQPNAALLWNEGKRPRSMANSNIDEINMLTLFYEVSFHSVFAPPIIFEPENTLVCSSWMEVNTLNEITITLSVEQLYLLNILVSQCNEYILSHLKTNYTQYVPSEKTQPKCINESLTHDSCIQSTEYNNKYFDHDNSLITTADNKINSQSNASIFTKKDSNTINKIPIDIIITGNQINLNFFNYIVKNEIKISEPLIFIVIHQPHVFFSLSNNSDSCQVIFFDLTMSLAPKNKMYDIEVPDSKIYSVSLFETKSNSMDEIPLAFFTLKISRPITIGQYKVELILGRAISLLLNKYKMDHCCNLLDFIKQSFHTCPLPYEATKNDKKYNLYTDPKPNEILNQTFQIDSIVSQYETDKFGLHNYDDTIIDSVDDNLSETNKEMNTKIIEIPVLLVNEHFWYSKPIVMNISTQQIFIKLSTENNDNIIFSIESVLSKIHCLWKKPSERMNGEITMNSVTISIGHNYSNSSANELILHPCTMTLEIVLSSDPWVPAILRPTKQIKILTDYISFHISPVNYNTLKLIWNEYKYLLEYNKNATTNLSQNSESDEQFYQDDLRAGAFQFLETNSSDLPLPYQIFFSEYFSNDPPKITWRYPQPRKLTKIEIQPVPIDMDMDIELHLQWYDEIQNCFREHTSFIFPKYEPMLLRLESWQAVSNTWQIIINNSCTVHSQFQIKSLVGCLRVDSYFSPNLVPQLQFSLSASSIKVNISYDIQKKSYVPRYDCISDVPPKHTLVFFILDQINIGFKLQEGEMNISAQSHVKIELLNYGTLTQIPILKLFFLFTSHHVTKPIPDIQYNIQTGAITCQFGPSMINSLTAAVHLWNNHSYFITMPYIICNDTNFKIIFGQETTNEIITLDSLQSYQYTWRVPTEHPRIRISVGNIDNLSWSNGISLHPETLMSFIVKNHKGKPHILILSITNMTPSIIKVTVSSQLSILNKTNYLLDAQFTKIKQIEEQKDSHQNLVLQTLSIAPENFSPSIMLHNELKVTLKLRFYTPNLEGPWSGPIPLHAVQTVNGNQNSWLVKIPMKDNMKKYRSIWCRLIIENINKIPRMLILLMPMYVVRSYLPYDTLLNFNLVDSKLEQNTIIRAKSAITLDEIQHLDLPGTMKDVYNLTIKSNEDSLASTPPVSVTYHMNIDLPELINDSYFTIEDIFNGKYSIMDSDLKWPFIGKQFSCIKWKQSDLPDTQTTVKVQHYGHLDPSNGLSRVIIVQPWALIVNTSGQLITLCNSTDILCNLDQFCVVAPPVIKYTFYIDLNIGCTTYRSQPLQLCSSQSFHMPQVNGLIPLNGHTSVVINCKHYIGYLNICSLDHNNMRIIHIQSSYIASNHSSINLKVLAVCANPSSGVLDIPKDIDENSVDLPKNINELGKPLALWTLIGRQNTSNEELVQYIILISDGNISCPIKLTELINEERPLPVLFSSCVINPLICVTLQELNNQYFFTVYNQPYPQFILYNHCPVSLNLTLAKKSKSKEPKPFSIDWNWTYRITSGKKAYLSFPHSVSCIQIPRVLIGLDKKPFKGWFASIELSVCESRLLPVPGQINDIKVLITKRAFTLDVVFKPAAQFEFSANEVRLRLAKSDKFEDNLSTNNKILNNVRHETFRNPTSSSQNLVSKSKYKLWPSIKCHIHTFIFTLFVDDIGFSSKAVISMTLDNIAATLDGNQDASKEEMSIIISINNIQIDNNAFIDGHYDFPVILVKQKKNIEEVYFDTSFLKPLSNVIHDLRQLDSAIILKFTLDITYHLTPVILDLEITLFTFEIFIEDRYCYYMLEILKNFKSTITTSKENNLTLDEFIPLHYLVMAHSQEFRNPLVFRIFTIKSFKVMISLHTSTTFYVALDRSPLDFTEFTKKNLITSSYQLGRSLSLHYFLNAIYGTGWALGSLEFWGSPGGLARSVGTGLYDFVTLSAQGMTEGPKEFFVGVLSGSASLVKHVTTGALSSVTKFASSWSRTFNRLTLEAEDLEQIEEIRRLRPQNFSQGIIQGLSEFGISLLGAVGGLVNHPIQYAIQDGPERRRGFVNTVAIGFVEAITKPISGAAELVAMTGEGFLAGVGWIKSPQLRSSLNCNEIRFGASELRYSWLILHKHLSSIERVLLTCDATMDNFELEQKLSELTLVLTDRFLYLIKDPNLMLPNVLRLPITQIVTPSQQHHDPSLITITIRMSAQNDTTYDRVADYVRKSQSFLNMESKTLSDNQDQTHRLLVSPQIRNYILNLIEFLKRHIQNKGYAVI